MMKKLLLFMLGALMGLPALARDFEYEYEGQTITYTVIDEEAKTVMTKAGERRNYTYKPGNYVLGKLILPSNPKDGDAEYTLIEIGYLAFVESTGLTEVIIPNSVQTIGNAAFYGCSGLTGVTIPNSVQTIGSQAFYECSGLTEVTIPNSVQTIDSRAFYGCI